MKIKKTSLKWLVLFCAFALALSALFVPGTFAKAEVADSSMPIDVYIVSGQSNAAGYSRKGVEKLNETFENIWYAGEVNTRYDEETSALTKVYYSDIIKGVRTGMDWDGWMGPEYGMAKALNEKYAGSKALIFKTAAGGTSLTKTGSSMDGEDLQWGNWYPTKKVNTQYPQEGALYRKLLKNVKTMCDSLKANGYTPRIKGMAWMQGEADLWTSHATYGNVLKEFITSVREEFAAITGDDGAKSMPFVIGEIATTFGSYNNNQVPDFNEVQRSVAADKTLGNVFTVPTADLIIVNSDGTINGTDQYHFNCQDAEILGVRFGEKLLENVDTKVNFIFAAEGGKMDYTVGDGTIDFTVTPDNGNRIKSFMVDGVECKDELVDGKYTYNGSVDECRIYAEFESYITCSARGKIDAVYGDGKIEITVIPNAGCRLKSLIVGGEEVKDSVTEGKYTYTYSGKLANDFAISAEFEEIPPTYYNITLAEYDTAQGTVIASPKGNVKEGYEIKVTARAKEGYEIKSVTFNGEPMEQDGKIWKMKATCDGEIKVTFGKIGEHTHTWSEYKSDADKHWKECECGEKSGEGAHTFDGDTCTVCGYKKPHTHTWSEYKNDTDKHWKECECGEKSGEGSHTFDGDACTVCGYKKPHTHTWSEYKTDADKHWKECECGEKSGEGTHTFDGDTCTVCGYKKSGTTPVVPGDDNKPGGEEDGKGGCGYVSAEDFFTGGGIALMGILAVVIAAKLFKRKRV